MSHLFLLKFITVQSFLIIQLIRGEEIKTQLNTLYCSFHPAQLSKRLNWKEWFSPNELPFLFIEKSGCTLAQRIILFSQWIIDLTMRNKPADPCATKSPTYILSELQEKKCLVQKRKVIQGELLKRKKWRVESDDRKKKSQLIISAMYTTMYVCAGALQSTLVLLGGIRCGARTNRFARGSYTPAMYSISTTYTFREHIYS